MDAADRKCANTRAHVDAGDMEIMSTRTHMDADLVRSSNLRVHMNADESEMANAGAHMDATDVPSANTSAHVGAGSMKITSAGGGRRHVICALDQLATCDRGRRVHRGVGGRWRNCHRLRAELARCHPEHQQRCASTHVSMISIVDRIVPGFTGGWGCDADHASRSCQDPRGPQRGGHS